MKLVVALGIISQVPRFLQLYLSISEASWFNWNAKLVADVIAVLHKDERFDEAETLIIETIKKLGLQERHICNFYCYLIESIAKHQLKDRVTDLHNYMKQLFCRSTSVYVKKRAYAAMISSLCEIGQPREAETLMEEMRGLGLKQSSFEFRSLVHAYGRIGLFEDVDRNVAHMQSQGFKLDTVCANMVLASLGSHGYLSETVSWLQRMKTSELPFSARTYNSVLNSCSSIMLMLQDLKSIPLSLEELMNSLPEDEAHAVQELVGSSVLDEVMEWSSSELKLDLHGMHSSSSYLIFLLWIDVLRLKFASKNHMIPTEITVVCGSGKHSAVKGQSPVKGLIKEIILRMKCPLKIDRRNLGCFVAKGKVLRAWLLTLKGSLGLLVHKI